MARACTDINWRYIGDSVPAFLTLAIMPFTYSIAYGLITGIITYAILNVGAWCLMRVSGGRITPYDYEAKDYWSWKVRGGLLPGWTRRALRGKRDFWREWGLDDDGGMEGEGKESQRESALSVMPASAVEEGGERTCELSRAAYGVRAGEAQVSPSRGGFER